MYYILYLSSLCRRRRWSDPHYDCYRYGNGIACTVRVNHREYQSETIHETEVLAREAAAMRAYLICRNFSVNDGMHPSSNTVTVGSSAAPPSNGNAVPVASRGYATGGGSGNGYATGSVPSQAGMTIGNGGTNRMATSQGVIVVGHSQIGI